MTISVVIPAHNAESFIEGTLASVLGQTHSDLEVIVVDDGSRDGTSRLVSRMAERDPRLRLVSGPCRGVSEARNEGVRRAHGDRIAFIDHDDLWDPDKLRLQCETMNADPRLGLVFTQARVESGGRIVEIIPIIEDPEALLARAHGNLIHWNYIPMSSVMARTDVLRDLDGPFDPRYRFSEDWDLWLRLTAHVGRGGVGFIPKPLTTYRIVPGRATERMGDLRLEDLEILETQIRAHPELERDDARRLGSTRHRIGLEAGYWLLREGRRLEARRVLADVWRRRPGSLRAILYAVASWVPWAHRAMRGSACV